MKMLLNKKGFSLIELMVVVAIIGILASVAVPNFQRFQRKARQSEAKTNLSAIYTAQKAFFAEWNQYTSDLPSSGFTPEGQFRYNVGFGANFATVPTGYFGAITAGNRTTDIICAVSVNCSAAVPAPSALPAASVPALAAFTASAHGLIGGALEDRWNINETKTIANNQEGL